MAFDQDDCYIVTGNQLRKLEDIMRRLYSADAEPFKVDEKRDLANLMHAILNGAQRLSEH